MIKSKDVNVLLMQIINLITTNKGCFYKNFCLIMQSYCVTKNYSKTLHHMCQNNIDNVQYNGEG